MSALGRTLPPQNLRHLRPRGGDCPQDFRKPANQVRRRKEASGEALDGEHGSVSGLSQRPPPLDEADAGPPQEGCRLLSKGDRKGSWLCTRLFGVGRLL